MAALQQNWLTDGLIDFEYKKYLLLAYLQQTAKNFDEKKLYPRLSELMQHYEHLKVFRETKMTVSKTFPQQVSALNLEKLKVEYRQLFEDDELLKEIDAIVDFALPQLQSKIEQGKELYERVEETLEAFPVGILPLRTDEGYFFLSDYLQKIVNVYFYRITIFENLYEKFRGIHTHFLFAYHTSLSSTYESVKYKLIEQNKELPNPAAYALEFKYSYPLSETMLPVAKRKLIRLIAGSKQGNKP